MTLTTDRFKRCLLKQVWHYYSNVTGVNPVTRRKGSFKKAAWTSFWLSVTPHLYHYILQGYLPSCRLYHLLAVCLTRNKIPLRTLLVWLLSMCNSIRGIICITLKWGTNVWMLRVHVRVSFCGSLVRRAKCEGFLTERNSWQTRIFVGITV